MLKSVLDVAKTGKNIYKVGKGFRAGVTGKSEKKERAMYWSAEWNNNIINIKSTHKAVFLYINEEYESYLSIDALREKKCQSCRMTATLPTGEDLKVIIEYTILRIKCYLYIGGNLIKKGQICLDKKTKQCVTYDEQNSKYKYDDLPCSLPYYAQQENQQNQDNEQFIQREQQTSQQEQQEIQQEQQAIQQERQEIDEKYK